MITIDDFNLTDLIRIKNQGGNLTKALDDYEQSNYCDENLLLLWDKNTGEIVGVLDISNPHTSNHSTEYKPWKQGKWGNPYPEHW